ncbi:cytochrome P450 [Diaporthe helianthi]|uniref:Cytochrome P450 n=1 Tax=Diaporthe helianthi TaxID=158607 RepID=A0A2P5HL98_DIAHE|nr:cytochrome P450 [Diaporthe helianthi]
MPYFAWVQNLPFGKWYRYADIGWPTRDGNKTIAELGETFVLVSPARNQIMTAYPPAVDRIYRDKNFVVPSPFKDFFQTFGLHLSSTNGVEWQRHRKITAQAFMESNHNFMWEKSIEGTMELLASMNPSKTSASSPSSSSSSSSVAHGDVTWTLATVRSKFEAMAMQVLVTVGFGNKGDGVPAGHQRSLTDCLGFLLHNIFITTLFGGLTAWVPSCLLPPVLRELKVCVADFGLYMKEAVAIQISNQKPQSEKSTMPDGAKKKTASLIEALVAANEAGRSRDEKSMFLSDSELYGNMFLFNLAGFETTAGNLTFALPFLAASPEFQDWLIEEIDALYDPDRPAANTYEALFPRLVRCLAFMHETLRMAGPAPMMLREPATSTSVPTSTSGSIIVPTGTWITAHFYGVHLSPRWGTDAEEFNPKRFVKVGADGKEMLAPPPEGALFMGWVFGPRVCPGKKFSQVEFVAVVAHLLSLYRVELVEEPGESKEDARNRLMGVLGDKYFTIGAQVMQPNAAAIRFVRRERI